ncbi:unnamed protein product, partial [Iphiclides podalirius]
MQACKGQTRVLSLFKGIKVKSPPAGSLADVTENATEGTGPQGSYCFFGALHTLLAVAALPAGICRWHLPQVAAEHEA